LWKVEENLPKSGKRKHNPSAILSTMYGKGVNYALNGIASSVHKFFWQPSGSNQWYQQLV